MSNVVKRIREVFSDTPEIVDMCDESYEGQEIASHLQGLYEAALEAADEIERLREEIQELKRDSTIFIIERGEAICKNADLQEELERLRAALKHYSCDCTDAACCPPFCGHIARTTLAGEKTND
jgi:DNA repair exonuclease SbcCD ATPase subunit